jgi:hypothetical protein
MLPANLTNLFTITAAPGTDIWRKPPTTDVFNGNFSLLSPCTLPQATYNPPHPF